MDGPYGECVVRFLFLYCSEIWFCCIARTGLQPLVLVDFSVCLNSYNLHKLSVTVVFLAPLYLVFKFIRLLSKSTDFELCVFSPAHDSFCIPCGRGVQTHFGTCCCVLGVGTKTYSLVC